MSTRYRMTLEEVGDDGDWTPVGTGFLGDWEARLIGLVLAGIDPVVHGALPQEAQQRVEERICAGRPPRIGMN